MIDSYSNTAFDSKKYAPLIHEQIPSLKTGTVDYDDYWDEQDNRCLYGYQPEGMPRITGEHYFYLNMCKINLLPPGERRKKAGNPFYRSLDRRLSLETEDAKKHGHGLLIGKPRRVGLSWYGAMQIIYEMIFYLENEVGVCAGKQDKADDFYKKVLYLLYNLRDEYRSGVYTKNDEELRLGYGYRENKQNLIGGVNSAMYIKTMFADSAAFEGKSMSLVIFEEAGLFENLIASFKSTEPCFKEGAVQFGSPIVYGTGGEIEKGSRGYKEMWDNPETFNLKKVFIPAYEYYPNDGVPDKKTGKIITFFDFRTGETDETAAEKHIIEERKIKSKSKSGYIKHVQSYPIKESEIFLKTKGGTLDTQKLNAQLVRLNEEDIPISFEIKQGRLEWVDDQITEMLIAKAKDTKQKVKIRVSRGSKVKFVNDDKGVVFKCADPINKKGADYNPDIGGVDSYDDEVEFEENNKKSYGASIIYRCYSGISKHYNFPAAYIKERGDSSNDDTFYENNVKLAIYYKCKMLIEYSKIAIVNYFKDVDAFDYMATRPDLTPVLGPTKSKNEYGQRVNKNEKALITRLLKAEVRDNVYQIFFREIIIDLIDYGAINTDLAMAYGMALMYKLEMFQDISDGIDEHEEDYNDDPLLSLTYYDVENGQLQIKSYGEEYNDGMQVFNPGLHLTGQDKIAYNSRISKERDEMLKIQKEIESKYKKDPMSYIIADLEDKKN